MNKHPLTFANMPLNRASSLRKGGSWLQEQLTSDNCLLIPSLKGKYLFAGNKLVYLKSQLVISQQVKELASELIFLGLDEEQALFVVDILPGEQEQLLSLLGVEYEFRDFRSSLHLLTPREASILAYGKSLSYWHSQHQYCGCCGSKSQARDGGHMRKCGNENCQKEHFPRTDPVVIMLVEYQPEFGPKQCLLAQHHNIAKKVVSTLAGFVDPGEALEEAVAREVNEEAGIRVDKVQYMASQPWPFPGSLMMGFFATTREPSIRIDADELVDAKWFTAEEVRTFDNWGDEGDNYQLPRQQSIARYLIDLWLENQSEK